MSHLLPIPPATASLPNIGGEMAALVYAKDWSKTPLGPIEQWPQSLRTTVSLCLASNFPINIAWGPDRVQIYNDGYWPLCGDKHPMSLGQDYKECWLSAWSVLGQAFEEAQAGQTRFLENQRMFLDRFGYLEETFFTFSFSPILDESGGVGGLFHPVTELTQQTLSERRLNVVRTVAERTGNAHTEEETASLLLETFREFDLDLPFVALYSLAPDAPHAQLEGYVGLAGPDLAVPATVSLSEDPAPPLPFEEVARLGHAVRVTELPAVFNSFSSGPYPEPPHTALAYPIYLAGSAQPAYFLVAGVSARRALDNEYALFYDLLIGSATNALSKARTLEDEWKRAEALAELDRAKTTFFSNISHEFRTPLTLMLGPLEDSLADRTNPLPPAQLERLELVQRNTLRLQRLVNSLLDFSRIEAGRLQASFQALDLQAYTSELASVFCSAMEKAGLAFEVDCQPVAGPVFVDPSMWEKIVFNLLSNALKFTFQGSVQVSLRQDGEQAVLEVRDTGGGIPATEVANLFARFYRIEGAKSRSHEGSGIGLAFVQELVKLHGGTITAESVLHEGTTFTVRLPMGAAHLPPDRLVLEPTETYRPSQSSVFLHESMQWLSETTLAATPPTNAPALAPDPQGAATLLVVDDNADMRAYVHRILAANPQWTIHTAADGLQALEMVAAHRPDLILSDVMMPRLDGFGLLQVLKQQPETASIPVVLLSARAGEEATLEGLDKGAADYLIKPFSARELLARVRSQLEITRTRQDNTLLRAAEEELKKFKFISDHAFDAFILMREDGTFAYLNDLALQRWGYTREEAASLRVPDVDPVFQEVEFRKIFTLAQQQGALPTFETIHQRKDGSRYPVEVSMGGILLEGQPHLFAIARDITEQVATRQQIEQREKEAQALASKLAATNQELSTTNTQLTRTNTDLDNFIYTASHDLRAPISNIEGLLYALAGELPPEQRVGDVSLVLEMMQGAVDRFKRTIGHLTDISRLQQEHNVEAVSMSIGQVIEDVCLDLDPLIQDTQAQIEVDVDTCPTIYFSAKNLRSVVYNLLSNALKYRAPERPVRIQIQCESTPTHHVLTVTDNGLGLEPKHLSQLFSMFKRFHTHVEGSGVGLYMVKKMVENENGHLEVQSQPGVGSTFRVYFRQ